MAPTSSGDDAYNILRNAKPSDHLKIECGEGSYDIRIDGTEHYPEEPPQNAETWIRHATPGSDEYRIEGSEVEGFTIYLNKADGSRSITIEAEVRDGEEYIGKPIQLSGVSTIKSKAIAEDNDGTIKNSAATD